MPLITINQADIADWHDTRVPAEARLYANRDFQASDGTFVAHGSDSVDPSFYQSFTASLVSGKIRIAQGDAYSTTDALGDNGLSTYTLAIYDADGVLIKNLLSNVRIPAELNPTDWTTIRAYSAGKKFSRAFTYLHDQAILALMAGYQFLYQAADAALNASLTAAYQAADSALNATLSAAIALKQDLLVSGTNIKTIDGQSLLGAGDIQAVANGAKNEINIAGSNWTVIHPELLAAKQYRHSSVTGHAAMVTEASANPGTTYIYMMNGTVAPSADATHPDNLILNFNTGGILAPASGVTVNINPPMNAPRTQLFAGLGSVVIKSHRGAGSIYGGWWLPDGKTAAYTITAAQRAAMQASQANNYGSELVLPLGTYRTDAPFQFTHGKFLGSGAHPDAGATGTILELTANGQAAVQAMPGASGVVIGNMTLYAADAVTGAQGVLLTGESGVDQSINTVIFRGLKISGFEDQIKCVRIGAGNFLFDTIIVEADCVLHNYSHSGLYCDSVNSAFYIHCDNIAGKWNGTSRQFHILRAGSFFAKGQGRGRIASAIPPGYTETNRALVTAAGFNTSTDVITATAHGFENGDSVRAICLATSNNADLPTASNFTFADGNKAWVHKIDANSFTLHYDANSSNAGGAHLVNLTAAPLQDVTFFSNRPNTAIASQRPYACFYFGSQFGGCGVRVSDWQDEGVPYFAVFEDNESIGINGPLNYRVPFVFDHCMSQGQILFKRGAEVLLLGGTYPADFLQDDFGVKAHVRNHGARFLIYNNLPVNRAGFSIIGPATHADFRGNSFMAVDDTTDGGFFVSRKGNDSQIFGIESANNQSQLTLRTWVERLGTGIKAAFWYWYNSIHPDVTPTSRGGNEIYAGFGFQGSLSYKGRLLNERTPYAMTSGSGTYTFDLLHNNEFTVTPNQNATLEFINKNSDGASDLHTQLVTLIVKTSGTTSYNLTAGTNVIMQGTFATGKTSGAYFVITFFWDPVNERLIEVSRSTIPDPVTVKNIVVAADTASSIEFKPRTGSGNAVFMYCPSTNELRWFAGGNDIMRLDSSTTSGDTRLLIGLHNNTVQRVTVGANDSGGTGFRVLRIPN